MTWHSSMNPSLPSLSSKRVQQLCLHLPLSALRYLLSRLHPHPHPFIQMRETCLRCPFSFGYPSEQSLWTAYPFTAINNSLSLPPYLPSIQHLTPPPQLHHHHHPSSCSSSSRAICYWVCCLGFSPPFSLSVSAVSVDLTLPRRLQFITRRAQMSAPPFPSSRSAPHADIIPLCFQTVADLTKGQPFLM